MNEERRLTEDLRSLAAADAAETAPAELELRLRAAFRERPSVVRRPAWALPLGISAVAASMLLVASLAIRTPRHVVAPPPAPVELPAAPPVIAAHPPNPPEPVQVARPRRRPGRPPAATRAEVVTPFVPLEEASSRPSQLVRIRMPRGALRSFGFPINEDCAAERVSADVLLGEDGTALAIRFVR